MFTGESDPFPVQRIGGGLNRLLEENDDLAGL